MVCKKRLKKQKAGKNKFTKKQGKRAYKTSLKKVMEKGWRKQVYKKTGKRAYKNRFTKK